MTLVKAKVSGVFASTETVVAFGVMLTLAALTAIKDNRRGFIAAVWVMAWGMVVLGGAPMLFRSGSISGVAWMILTGLGAYLAYVLFNTFHFERWMVYTRFSGTAVFAIYLADSAGYTGSIVLQLGKDLWASVFFESVTLWVSVIGLLVCLLTPRAFSKVSTDNKGGGRMNVLSVVTVYEFTRIEKPYLIKARLGDWIGDQNIKGTLIIAPEGINGTLSGPNRTLSHLIEFLADILEVPPLKTKWSTSSVHPFGKLKFPLKDEIVTMGTPKPDPTKLVGTYVEPEQWNALISDPDVTVVDTRNWYEVELGSFEGAVNPQTEAFRDFEGWVKSHLDPKKDKKVAMFCTGGIRCEKASSYMLEEGFGSVFHLQGGILNYLEKVKATQSMWEGECFVFDDRVTLSHGLEIGTSLICKACGKPTKDAKLVDGPSACPHCLAPMVSRSSLETILS